jgi:hypothetical protein
MFDWILDPIGELPPIHWLLNLELWRSWPFTWISTVWSFTANQESVQWMADRFAGLAIAGAVIGLMFLHVVWYMWAWYRGAEIGYDPVKAVKWTSGSRAGKPKKHPVKLEVALTRRYAWPLIVAPFFLFTAGMYIWVFVLWPGAGSLMLMPIVWVATMMPRRIWFMWVARKAFRARHGNAALSTTLMEDVWNYYHTCLAASPKRRTTKAEVLASFEPSFEGDTWVSRRLIWGERLLATWRVWGIWRWLRVWEIFRFWGLFGKLLIGFAWPVAGAVAPFAYAKMAEDYERWMNPVARRYKANTYSGGKIVGDEVVKRGADGDTLSS